MGRRLCKMLFRDQFPQIQLLSFLELAVQDTGLLFVILIGINAQIAVKDQSGSVDPELLSVCLNFDKRALIFGIFHTAGREPLPDQLIQAELIS